MIALGVMSGSSLDGLDMAIVSVKDRYFEIRKAVTYPIPEDLSSRLVSYHNLSALAYIKLERDYTEYVAEAINFLLKQYEEPVEVIGLHGHTIVHLPKETLTVQLGNGGHVASRTGIDVVTDFRIQDVAAQGEGTPLASLVDVHLFDGYDCYLNLGGIANITKRLPQGAIEAYDICPCNQVLNYLSMELLQLPYDDGGNISRKGAILENATAVLDEFAYWATAPPKSLDNNWIKNEFLPRVSTQGPPADVLATMTDWIAKKIAAEIPAAAQKILVTGGGAYNSYLLASIEQASQKTITIPDNDVIDYKEAILMAYMAYCRVHEQHNVLSKVTHATADSIAGAYYKANK